MEDYELATHRRSLGVDVMMTNERQIQDVKIMQKVNRVNREAFLEKFPGQVEHCLRLTMERLQAGLDKRDGVDIGNPATWRMNTQELNELANIAHKLNQIRQGF